MGSFAESWTPCNGKKIRSRETSRPVYRIPIHFRFGIEEKILICSARMRFNCDWVGVMLKREKGRERSDVQREPARSAFSCNRDVNAASNWHVGTARCPGKVAGTIRFLPGKILACEKKIAKAEKFLFARKRIAARKCACLCKKLPRTFLVRGDTMGSLGKKKLLYLTMKPSNFYTLLCPLGIMLVTKIGVKVNKKSAAKKLSMCNRLIG